MILTLALGFAFLSFGLGLLVTLWRIVTGPTQADRILGLDTMVINVIALVLLFGLSLGTAVFFEAALLIALVGFVSTVAYCRFILRGDIIE